jgi:ubiquinone/menaquinone biosynthesis C-methylase UbiE
MKSKILTWDIAQKREKEFFIKYYRQIQQERDMKEICMTQIVEFKGQKILEIGCSPSAIIHHLKIEYKIGLDPLSIELKNFYKNNTQMICGKAEKIPLIKESIDYIICMKALDHMENPKIAIYDMHRVLKRSGKLLQTVHTYKIFNSFLINFDRHHPHHFDKESLEKFLCKQGFIISKKENKKYTLNEVLSTFRYAKLSAIKQFLAVYLWGQEYNFYCLVKEENLE